MELRISITKVHLFIFIGILVLFSVVMFVIAQTPGVPNPGHDISQLSGVAPNCDSISSDPSCIAAMSGMSLRGDQLSSRSALSWNSLSATSALNALKLGGIFPNDYCRKDGTNCLSGYKFTICAEKIGPRIQGSQIFCQDDETLVHGGCNNQVSILYETRPLLSNPLGRVNGWRCFGASVSEAVAICCK
jgi:hypothetical protein